MSDPPVQSVSQLTRSLKEVVEAAFPQVWVLGEVSNCTRARSGHIYLTLKDESSQLRAVIWRRTAERLRFDLEDGMEVVASGPVEVYQPRGAYQLIVRDLVPQGIGALELAFRQLHQKLEAEGLFDSRHKRPLPRFPRRIAVVTSPTGAAVRDILQVLMRRWKGADVVIVPVLVQGQGAAEQIASALKSVHRIPRIDLVIAGRGGGSLEDLWPFNEEIVARAIHACAIPVISAVGHEVDLSIADLVADRRALTPSEAAELAVPQRVEVLQQLRHLQNRLITSLRQQAVRARTRLDAVAGRRIFVRPRQPIHDLLSRLDELDGALRRAIRRRTEVARQRVADLASSLDALSPLNVLKRGYTVTTRPTHSESGRLFGDVVRSAQDLHSGEEIVTLFHDGQTVSRVEDVRTDGLPARE